MLTDEPARENQGWADADLRAIQAETLAMLDRMGVPEVDDGPALWGYDNGVGATLSARQAGLAAKLDSTARATTTPRPLKVVENDLWTPHPSGMTRDQVTFVQGLALPEFNRLRWRWEDGLSEEYRVLVEAIAHRTNLETLSSWPSKQTLYADYCAGYRKRYGGGKPLSVRTMNERIAALKACGLLHIEKRENGSNVYSFNYFKQMGSSGALLDWDFGKPPLMPKVRAGFVGDDMELEVYLPDGTPVPLMSFLVAESIPYDKQKFTDYKKRSARWRDDFPLTYRPIIESLRYFVSAYSWSYRMRRETLYDKYQEAHGIWYPSKGTSIRTMDRRLAELREAGVLHIQETHTTAGAGKAGSRQGANLYGVDFTRVIGPDGPARHDWFADTKGIKTYATKLTTH